VTGRFLRPAPAGRPVTQRKGSQVDGESSLGDRKNLSSYERIAQLLLEEKFFDHVSRA
jgi:hypothetical protein